MRAFEALGYMGNVVEQLIARQIPKTKGPGHRPIALFSSVFRVWGRARAETLRT